MRKLSLVLLFAVSAIAANAQTMANYAGANFSASSTPGAFVPLSGSTTVPALLADDIASGPLPIGFSFYYMGKAYTQVRAGSDGYLSLFTSGSGSSITNNLNSGTAVERPVIAPFWDDMDGRGTGAVASYLTSGSPGSRVFTFEWLNWVRTGGTTPVMSFQVKLFESTGIIQLIYRSDAAALTGATVSIGLSAVATGAGNFVSLSDATAAPTTSTATETTSISTKPATDQVYTFTPPQTSVADPTTMTFTAITLTGMTVNWVDNSTNETNFNVYRSLDGITYTWVALVNSTTTAATGGAYSYVASGLNAGVTYYWQVVANSEGVPSGALSGNQATGACSIAGGTYTVGATGTYTSVANALTALVANGITGAIILELQTDYAPEGAITFPFVPCASATNTITIRPAAGVAAPIVLTSAAAAPTFTINGGQYYIIDGRNGGSGSNKFITIANSSTTGQALQFINEGANNIVRYCTIQGVATSATSGVVVFSTTTGANGNDNNTLDNNDIRDGATTPANLVYASGTTTTAAQNNSGNIISNNNLFNFFIASATDAAGVRVDGGNTDWTITANNIYQTATRTSTAGATGRGVYINNTSGNNFVVTDNFIGGSAPGAAGTAWTNAGSFANRFEGIRMITGSTTASSVQNNVIRNFAWSSSSGATTLPGVWAGIYVSSGITNVGNISGNTIGSSGATGSIAVTTSTTGGVTVGIGSATTGTGAMSISNNTIGGFTLSGSTAGISQSFNGIWVSSSITGAFTINGNTIGSTSTAGSIQYATAGTGTTAAVLQGILQAATPSGGATISNNLIANFSNAYVPATANANSVLRGILASSGSNIITLNTVRNLSASAATTGTGSTASVIGISMTSTSTTTGVTSIDQNTVFALSNTNATAASAVTGIHIGNATSGRNNVTKNLIYNIAASTTSATADIRGISFTSGLDTVKNNMIRLGTDVPNGIPITGIWETISTTNSAIYFNSVYIGGTGVGTQTGNTYAFRTDQTTNVRTFQNNIFINGRSNATTGGKHYAVRAAGTAPNPTGLSLNYNDYQATGTGAVFGFFNSLDVASLAAWRTATGQDANSISGNPQYIDPTGATPDLHISAVTPTEIEAAGLAVAAITDDYDGQARASFTPTDMGADAGNFISADLTAPVITYTLIPATACLTDRSLSATITDLSGVNSTPGTKPRLYYKKSTDANAYVGNTNADNGWKYVEASNAASPFTFTTDFTLLQAAVAPGDVIQYFVVAQDLAVTPIVGINSGTFAVAPTSVALTGAAFPIGPVINSYNVSAALPTSVTVGAAGTYTTLTGAAGLFADINAKYLSGNTTVTILDAAITETGANALNAINYGCSGGPYTLTIKPNTGVTTVLSGSSATPLIDLNGADNVIFDGSNNGSSSKDMTIRNTNTSGPTFRFINDATTNTIQNTIVESAVTSTTSGTILFSTAVAGTLGNSNNTISNCDIRDRSDAAGVPANAVYSSGTAGFPNASNSISSSNIFNHTNAGILVAATGAGNTWTVNANNVYQTAARAAALTGISVQGGNGHTITNNFIGGTAAAAGGTNLVTSSTFRGIDLTVGIVSPTSVQGNTIRNIRSSVTGFTASYGIFLQAGAANIGNIAGNTVGSANVAERFEINGDSYGIRVISTNSVNLSNNTVNNFGTNATPSTGEFYFGISVEGAAGAHTVVNNTVMNVTNTSTPDASFSTQTLGMNITASGIQTVRGNIIHDIGSTSATAPTSNNNRVWGLILSGTAAGTVVEKNNIYNIYGSSAGAGARADVITLLQSQTLANGTYSNNMLASGSVNPNSERFIFGILDLSATPSVSNYYFNSVSITGTASGANNTYAFNRNSTATVDIKSNIFSNSRSGGTGFHVAIANTNAAATGWSATASNYNDLYSATSTTIGQWLGTALANNRTLTGWRAAQGAPTPGSGGDANSFTEAPAFVSATNLHIPNATATQIESGGTSAGGITTDIDNETRPGPTNTNGGGTQVDVGADEFDGTPASGMTYVSSTTTQANVSNVPRGTVNQQIIGIEIVTTGTLTPLDVSSFTLNTNGTTAPLTDITNAKLWYTGTSSTFATTTQYGSTVAAPNGSFSIPGTQALSTGTNYFWLTYDVPCGATLTNPVDAECSIVQVGEAQNPTVQAPAGTRTIVASAGLSGTVTIGAAGTYPSLTGAAGLFAAINANGLSANLTADIVDASVTETGAVALNAVNYVCGGPFTILIKPTATSTLTGSLASNALIRLNGADNVTIDGSNSGGTDRSLTITNTATTAPSAISLISAGAGAGAVSNTIKNTNISVGTSASTGYGIAIGGNTPGTSGADNDNITVQNNSITAASIGVYAIGTAAVSAGGLDNLLITGNTISSVTTVASKGIMVGNALTSTISLNTVSVENNTSSVPVGISLETGFVSSTVTRNMITKSLATNTGGYGGRGITIGTGSATSALIISNNVIYGVNGTNWSSFGNASSMGIAIGIIGNSSTLTTTTGGVDLYFNSVNMFGTYSSTTACLTTALYVGSGATALNLKDNVFVNSLNNTGTGTPSKAYAVYSAAANTAFTDINYNDYFTSGAQGVLGFLAADQANLAAWQTATAQDANSINADPLFNNNSFLQPQLGSPVVAAGTPAGGITIDITGFTRSVTTPTIGAYEQGADGAAPSITYTPLTFTCATGDRALNGVAIADATGVPTAGALQPRIYFRKNAGAWFSAQGTLASGTGISGTWDFTITAATMGGLTGGDVVQYYVIAQDLAGVPNIGSNPAAGLVATDVNTVTTAPTTPNSFTISSTLNGTYTVGAAGNYTTLTAAITAYNTSCLTGPVVFNLIDATYSAGETFPISINANPDASSVNTLTIKPATGVTASVSGSNATTILKMFGADYVTIDGSNNGSTTRDLTITNTGTGAIMWMGTDATAGATNNTLKNFNMVGPGAFGGQGIIAGSGATFGSAAENGRPNSNNTIQNLTAKGVQNAVFTLGDAATLDNNWLITQNDFGSTVVAEKLSFRGIAVQNASNFTISMNKVIGVSSSTSTSATMTGILVGSTLNGGTITKNELRDIRQNNTTGWGSNGIYLNSSSAAANVVVSNNFISAVASEGFDGQDQGDNGYGIMVNTGGGYEIYFNTVLMNTEQPALDGQTAAINIESAVAAAGVNIRNNIFVTTQTNGTNYAVINQGTAAVFAAINYNDYVSTEFIGYQTLDQATLTDWQTATTQDANSISVAPVFVSATDLHLVPASNCNLHRRGTPIAGITVDYDNDTRDATRPDMGADEYLVPTGGTMTWTGAVSTDWFDVRNWASCEIPGITSNVVINGSLPNYPNVSANVTINSLTLNTGSSLTAATGVIITLLSL